MIDVLNLLKRCGFPQTRWRALGLTLGLHKNTLNDIERDNHVADDCLTECLSKWLSRADNVESRGGATFDSLSDALKSMNENAAADKLDQESKLISLIVLVLTVCVCILILEHTALATDIFNTHHTMATKSSNYSSPPSLFSSTLRIGRYYRV